jgi:hypothetical protein
MSTQSLPPRRSRRLINILSTTNPGAGGTRTDAAMAASMSESTLEDTKTEDLERQAGLLFSFFLSLYKSMFCRVYNAIVPSRAPLHLGGG